MKNIKQLVNLGFLSVLLVVIAFGVRFLGDKNGLTRSDFSFNNAHADVPGGEGGEGDDETGEAVGEGADDGSSDSCSAEYA